MSWNNLHVNPAFDKVLLIVVDDLVLFAKRLKDGRFIVDERYVIVNTAPEVAQWQDTMEQFKKTYPNAMWELFDHPRIW